MCSGGGFRASRCVLFADFDASTHGGIFLEQCQPNGPNVWVTSRRLAIGCDWMSELQRQQIDSFAAQPAISASSQIKLGLHAPKANQFLRRQTQSKLSQLYSRCISTVPHCHIACQQIVLPKLQAECVSPFQAQVPKQLMASCM